MGGSTALGPQAYISGKPLMPMLQLLHVHTTYMLYKPATYDTCSSCQFILKVALNKIEEWHLYLFIDIIK